MRNTPTRQGLNTAFASSHASRYPSILSIILILPLAISLTAGFLYPVARLVTLSFADGAESYMRLWRDPLYAEVLTTTVTTAGLVTICCLGAGYPVAYAMALLRGPAATFTAACVFISLWTSVLIRSYAWIVLLQRNGIVNDLILTSGLSPDPMKLIYTQGAVVAGMTHILVPFAILPIYAAVKAIPSDLNRAAANLGAGRAAAFMRITLPLSLPGVFAGAVLCFVLALGFYITPALLGGPGSMLMATLIGQQTTVLLDWPFAAALSTVLLAATLFIVFLFRRALTLNKGFSSVH